MMMHNALLYPITRCLKLRTWELILWPSLYSKGALTLAGVAVDKCLQTETAVLALSSRYGAVCGKTE